MQMATNFATKWPRFREQGRVIMFGTISARRRMQTRTHDKRELEHVISDDILICASIARAISVASGYYTH